MEKEFSAKQLDEAKELAIAEFRTMGAPADEIEFEILEQPVKKLFGTKGEYKVKAIWNAATKAEAPVAQEAVVEEKQAEVAKPVVNAEALESDKVQRATAYLRKLIAALGVENFEIVPESKDELVVLNITGDDLGVVIGRRGETLDALQYLTILASNRGEESYCRISVDCCGYREKRKEALESLAEKTAHKVLKTGRRFSLEPMNPYERRIIHSKVSEIEGVSSRSTGEEPYRKVVISSNNPRPDFERRRDNNRRGGRQNSPSGRNYKQSSGFSTSFEREYKRRPSEPVEYSQETVDTEKTATLYGKIEL